MFRKKTGGDGGADDAKGKETGAQGIIAPPLKPFSKKGSHVPTKAPAAASARTEPSRRTVDIPGASRRMERGRTGQAESKKLIVGRDICLKGEITSCDKLVVEGQVEASLTDARVIEVAPSGTFKGDAKVEEADISGRFEGDLVVKDTLIVRATGRIGGSIRYGRIVIESGGEISGDMQALNGAGDDSDRDSEED